MRKLHNHTIMGWIDIINYPFKTGWGMGKKSTPLANTKLNQMEV